MARVPAGNRDTDTSIVLLGEELAVCTLGDTVLGQHESVEEVALAGVVTEEAQDSADDASLDVDSILGRGVGGADVDIEDTLEHLLGNAGLGVIVDTRALGRLGPAAGSSRSGGVGLLVTVGAGNDNAESTASLTGVHSSGRLDTRSPEGTLVVGDGRDIFASAGALVGVERGITLDVQVEGSAETSGITLGSATSNIVACKSVQTHVAVGVDRRIQVLEGLSIAGGSNSVLSKLVVDSIGLERSGSVRGGLGSVSIRLGSAGVLGVDEATVGTDLVRRRASSVRGEGEGVGPAHRSAGRGNNAGGDAGDCSSVGSAGQGRRGSNGAGNGTS